MNTARRSRKARRELPAKTGKSDGYNRQKAGSKGELLAERPAIASREAAPDGNAAHEAGTVGPDQRVRIR